jgi:beta-galactosidase
MQFVLPTNRISLDRGTCCVIVAVLCGLPQNAAGVQQSDDAALPAGVEAVWDLQQAHRESTATRERICINGLWRWQPASGDGSKVPDGSWGFFKVPGCWPGVSDYMQKDCQTVFAHPDWRGKRLGQLNSAWYEREITVPDTWKGRRITLEAAYINSLATVFLDGQLVGLMRYPAGELDLSKYCQPGSRHLLSMFVVATPLRGVMLSFRDTASAREVKGRVARRGLCGDVYLSSTPKGPRIRRVNVITSVRHGTLDLDVGLSDLDSNASYELQATVMDGDRAVATFPGKPLQQQQLSDGRYRLSEHWVPDKLWDLHTPDNIYHVSLTLRDSNGKTLDQSQPLRFGFREFWIDGRDFYLNGTRVYLSSVPLDNAQVGAAWATYEAARESMQRLASFGINFVYTHNYGCEPGSHLSFDEILRAADDVGMLIAFSLPHFSHYSWDAADAAQTNGYADHAAFYVDVARNHPSVVAYSTSHNATGYAEDMNPDMIDGIQAKRDEWSERNVRRAKTAESIIRQLDASRIIYHHASGNLGSMHTSNFYANFVPIQEMSDWFEHWSTEGVKPLFTCEYSVPMPWDWTMYRGWYQGKREFGSARVPWEFCIAEWNAQFVGDRAYKISVQEKENLRWEARRFREGATWHRWDYPHQVGSRDFLERYPIYAEYFADNWPAFRTWGVSANSPWNHGHYWTLRPDVDKSRKQLPVRWANLQRPGFSPDYIEDRYEKLELAYERSDWLPTVAAETLIRYNGPLLGYIAGKPGSHTGKDHNFVAGELLEKQLIVINNSREPVRCKCRWSLEMPTRETGERQLHIETGQQARVSVRFRLPEKLSPGSYFLQAEFEFDSGEKQQDRFELNILPAPKPVATIAKVALFDPHGETRAWLDTMNVEYSVVTANSDVSGYELLVVGKNALTVDQPAPDIGSVRQGLRVLVMEQTAEVLEQRFGFRVQTYGLRRLFGRVPDHAVLAQLDDQHLHDWRGSATVAASRLDYFPSSQFNGAPTVRWCGIPVSRLWRCGNRGNVATVLIEKPAKGNFLSILDGGYSLQYSPLLEYREGNGVVMFCQVDVTARTEPEPAAGLLSHNLLQYLFSLTAPTSPTRKVLFAGGNVWKEHLDRAGILTHDYQGGRPTDDNVLVVAAGGETVLEGHADAIANWLQDGGRLVAFGLRDTQANAFLPTAIGTQDAEHIATYFPPPAVNSALAGVSPADVHNAVPANVPLITTDNTATGLTIFGNGILATDDTFGVVYCQLPAENFEVRWGVAPAIQRNRKRTYRRNSVLVSRLLANLGVASKTPVLQRFAEPVADSSKLTLLHNGNFTTDADQDGTPDHWLFSPGTSDAACSRELASESDGHCAVVLDCPVSDSDKTPSTMLAQHGVPVRKGQWYRLSLRVRSEQLARETVTVTVTNTSSWHSLFEYQRFQPSANWNQYTFEVQANDTEPEQTRFQIWFSGSGKLWLSDVNLVPIADPQQGRWLEGLYLDTPEEWDDPYRFFRW